MTFSASTNELLPSVATSCKSRKFSMFVVVDRTLTIADKLSAVTPVRPRAVSSATESAGDTTVPLVVSITREMVSARVFISESVGGGLMLWKDMT